MKRLKGILAVLMAAVMAMAAVACNATSTPAATPAGNDAASPAASAEITAPAAAIDTSPITLTAFIGQQDIGTPGIHPEGVFKAIADKTGITINWIAGDPKKLDVLFAGGNLPDLIEFENSKANDAVKSGAIIQLDDLLEKYGQDLLKRDAYAIKVQKAVAGNGKTYYLPTSTCVYGQNEKPVPNFNGFIGIFVRFDIYQAIGSPKFNGRDEFIDLMKKMQDYAQSKSSDGKKIYAISGFSDWGFWSWPYSVPTSFGGYCCLTDYCFISDPSGDKLVSRSNDANSDFWQWMAWYNKAYREGIVDPEAFTQKSDQYGAKIANGTCLTAAANWWYVDKSIVTDPNAGLYLLPGTETIMRLYNEENPLGNGEFAADAISTNCKHPERAMQFLNFLATDEGSRLIMNGIKGTDWDVVDGKPQLIGDRLAAVKNGTDTDYKSKFGIGGAAFFKYYPGTFTCADGYPVDLSQTAEILALSANAADKNFVAAYDTDKKGLLFPGQIYQKWVDEGKMKPTALNPITQRMMAPLSDEASQIKSKADNYIQDNIASIIMAKDDAEFAAVKQKTIEAITAFGIEKYYTEYEKLYNDAAATMSQMGSWK